MSYNFTGQTALVTGSTSGIGRATAVKLAAAGAHVIVSGRNVERGDAIVSAIRAAGGTADFIAVELSSAQSVRGLAARARELGGGRIDILVNNAGIFPGGPTTDTAESDIDEVWDVNVKAPFLLVAELVPGMTARGSGAIVNVTTMVASFGFAGLALYGASKAALQLLTKAWAAEFAGSGVRVNAVSPGPTRTEGTAVMGDGIDQMAATTPSGIVASPDDIADGILFLASDSAKHIHGAVLPVDGGRLAV